MPTLSMNCTIKNTNTICPECGRMVPDWCAKDDLERVVVEAPPAPPVSDEDEAAAEAVIVSLETERKADAIARLEAEQKSTTEKVIKAKSTTKGTK